MPLDDYGSLLRSGQAAVPDYAAQAVQNQLLNLKKQELAANLSELQRKQQQQEQFQNDLHGVLLDPSADNVSALILKHPEFADQVKSAWDLKDRAAQKADLTQMGEVYSAAANGKWDLAAKSLQSRIDADRAAGHDTADDQAILDALKSGDPVQQKAALGMIGTHLAAVAGPDHFASVMGGLKGGYTLDAGAVRFDDNGNVVARSPYLKTADGGILEADGTGGAGPASPGAAATTAPGGFDEAVEHVLSNEGGYNPKDMNGAPVNFGINQKANPGVDVKNLTRDQAKQIYHDKYWVPSGAENLPANLQAPYLDVYIRNPAFAKKALADSGGDPTRFMAASSAYFQKLAQKPSGQPYAQAWANRDAKNAAIAAGVTPTAPVSGDGAPPGYHWLTQPKGKDAPSGFRWTKDGNLEAIPGGPAAGEALDDSTTTFYAQQVLAGGQMPTLGMGKSATQARQAIMKKVAQMAGAEGLTGKDLAIQVAHYKAGVANVTNLEKQIGTVEGNERTFAANAQQVAELAKKLPAQTASRFLNTPIQTYLRQTNDPTVAAMDVAIKTAANEYARLVTSSPSGAGVLSDSARMEYQGVIEGNFPLKQKLAALHQMSVDAKNRSDSLRTQLKESYAHLGDRSPELTGKGSDLPKGAKVIGTHNGKRVILLNGKRMVEQ